MGISLFGTIFMKISYGIHVQDSDDPLILLTEEAINGLSEASIPGAFLVDFLPILKYVPIWFPGAGFQKKAAHWSHINASMKQKPFDYVKDQLVSFFPPPLRSWILNNDFLRQMAQLRHRCWQPLLNVFHMKTILNGPWRKNMRKMWLLLPT